MSTGTTFKEPSFEAYYRSAHGQAIRLPGSNSPYTDPDSLEPVKNYSVSRPGKGLRETLVVMTADLISRDPADLGPFVHAIRGLHASALDIDDIQDGSDVRRGETATHIAFGEDVTTLGSISLIGEFFTRIPRLEAAFGPENTNRLTQFCGQKIIDLCSGQNRDLDPMHPDDLEEVEETTRLKTGSALEISIVGTAILFGRDDRDLRVLSRYCQKLAIIYQARDDILDATSQIEVLGKPTGCDQANNRATFVSAFDGDLAALDDYIREQTRLAGRQIGLFPAAPLRFVQLAEYAMNRQK